MVIGTKSTVDDLLPKSNELLTQTQRQERAIGEIHYDLNSKTNKIIANLDKMETRLKKQEVDVANLALRPVPADILLSEPTLEVAAEYDSSRFDEDFIETTTPPIGFTTMENSSNETVATTTEKRADKRKGGVIFPSVKNKPLLNNSTFVTSEVVSSVREVKVRSRAATGNQMVLYEQNKFNYFIGCDRKNF